MPKMKISGIDNVGMDMSENPDDYFPDFEVERRMAEIMRRMCGMTKDGNWKPGFKPTFDMETGQNYEGEQLSDEELKRRGYA